MNVKALDLGEGYLIGAERKEGELVFTIERNFFYACAPGQQLYERIARSDLYHLKLDGKIIVFGEDALSIARKLENSRDTGRPVYAPGDHGRVEKEVLNIMLKALLGKAQPGETIHLNTHARVVDGSFDPTRVQQALLGQLGRLGYRSQTQNRARAVLFHDNPRAAAGGAIPDTVSICFSEELVDVAFWVSGHSLFEFASIRGGRWIDESVAKMKEISPLVVERLREHDINLSQSKTADKVSMMVGIYIEHMIQYILQMVAAQVRKAGLNLPASLAVHLSGKNAAIAGFEERFLGILKGVDLPFKVSGVQLGSDPLRAAAGGTLTQALKTPRRTEPARSAPKPSPKSGAARVPKVKELFGGGKAMGKPAAAPPASAAPSQDTAELLKKIRLLEERLADVEEAAEDQQDSGMVERLRRQAGISSQQSTFMPPRIKFEHFFKKMVSSGASDLFLSAGSRPAMRVDGSISFMSGDILERDYCRMLVENLARKPYKDIFKNSKGVDVAVVLDGIGRFRANLFHQRGNIGCVFRHIKRQIPSFEELNLPARTLMKLAKQRRGLILVTGVAGSGKSTSIAAMIEYINQTTNRHIVTVEDPIEFVYDEKQSVVDQREVGFDTANFPNALKAVVRQSPDVIFIGEMRDKETMEASISAAETGHLVLSTLHTVNAQQTVERIITFFPTYQHDLIRMQLSMVLAGVVSLRLLPKKDGGGRAPAVEIMLSTPTIKDLLLEGKTHELYSAISDDSHFGNQTFNESLRGLYQAGVVTLEEALAGADNPDELKLEIRGISRGTRAADFDLA